MLLYLPKINPNNKNMKAYKCKILTPDFFKRVNDYIEKISLEQAEKDILLTVPNRDLRLKLCVKINAHRNWSSFCFIWNRQFDAADEPLFKEFEFFDPEYTEEIFHKKQEGFQSQPRIEWNGKIEKIDDIHEIFHFTVVEV